MLASLGKVDDILYRVEELEKQIEVTNTLLLLYYTLFVLEFVL